MNPDQRVLMDQKLQREEIKNLCETYQTSWNVSSVTLFLESFNIELDYESHRFKVATTTTQPNGLNLINDATVSPTLQKCQDFFNANTLCVIQLFEAVLKGLFFCKINGQKHYIIVTNPTIIQSSGASSMLTDTNPIPVILTASALQAAASSSAMPQPVLTMQSPPMPQPIPIITTLSQPTAQQSTDTLMTDSPLETEQDKFDAFVQCVREAFQAQMDITKTQRTILFGTDKAHVAVTV